MVLVTHLLFTGVATCEGACPNCEYKEEIYEHGQKWIDDCNACECLKHGTITCLMRQVLVLIDEYNDTT